MANLVPQLLLQVGLALPPAAGHGDGVIRAPSGTSEIVLATSAAH